MSRQCTAIEPAMTAKQREKPTVSLTAELVQKIGPRPYKTYIAKLIEEDAITGENYKNSKWANYFRVDASNIVRNGQANANHVFDLFGSYSGHTGTEVRIHLLKNIVNDIDFTNKNVLYVYKLNQSRLRSGSN